MKENKYTKKIIIVLTSILILFIIRELFLYSKSDPEFLASIRYKELTDWQLKKQHYKIRVSPTLSEKYPLYYDYLFIRLNEFERTIIYWTNDSLNYNMFSEDSQLVSDSQKAFFRFDSTFINFKDSLLIPIKIGKTYVYSLAPTGIDSTELTIKNREGKLRLYDDGMISLDE